MNQETTRTAAGINSVPSVNGVGILDCIYSHFRFPFDVNVYPQWAHDNNMFLVGMFVLSLSIVLWINMGMGWESLIQSNNKFSRQENVSNLKCLKF